MNKETTSLDFFEDKYRRSIDPWNFEGSAYERERYAAVLNELGTQRWQRGFEPGCSIGVLTELLAPHCEALEAIDISPTAADRARERCRNLPNVSIRCGSLPASMPTGYFDLIVLSEIGYYFEKNILQQIMAELVERLLPGGILIAAHWLGTSADHVLTGDEVHDVVRATRNLEVQQARRFDSFRLDRMVPE